MRKVLLVAAVLGVGALNAGCVSMQGYDDAVKRVKLESDCNEQLRMSLAEREAQLVDLEKKVQELAAIKAAQSNGNFAVDTSELDKELERLRKELAGSGGDWNIIRAEHAVGVRLDDGKDTAVLFRAGSWSLTDSAKTTLDKLAPKVKTMLDKDPSYLVRVDGHTDSDPIKKLADKGVEDNTDLGCRRANEVRQYLVSQGIAENRCFVMSGGEWMPLGDEKKHNRRVEIWVSDAAGFSLAPHKTLTPKVDKKADAPKADDKPDAKVER